MDKSKLNKSLGYIADSVESGYSALFTYGVKEVLNTEERRELSQFLRNLTYTPQLIDSNLFKENTKRL